MSAAPGRRFPAPPPRDVLEGVRRREELALGALFDCYFQPIYDLAHRLMGDTSLAEEVAQDVFLKVHRAAHQLDAARDPTAWLLQITTNTCRDRWRSRAFRMARRTTSWESMLEQGNEPSAPEDVAAQVVRQRVVQEALLGLPEDLRAIVILHDYHEMQHEEIAKLLGINYAAVRKRYSRALQRLAEQLKGRLD